MGLPDNNSVNQRNTILIGTGVSLVMTLTYTSLLAFLAAIRSDAGFGVWYLPAFSMIPAVLASMAGLAIYTFLVFVGNKITTIQIYADFTKLVCFGTAIVLFTYLLQRALYFLVPMVESASYEAESLYVTSLSGILTVFASTMTCSLGAALTNGRSLMTFRGVVRIGLFAIGLWYLANLWWELINATVWFAQNPPRSFDSS